MLFSQGDLQGKKITQLREIANDLGIKSPYKFKKDELIDLILQNYASKEQEAEKQEDYGYEERKVDIKDINMDVLPIWKILILLQEF